jgi:hypothetical protein
MPHLGPPIVIPVPPPEPPPTVSQKLILTIERDGQALGLPLSADVDDHVWCVAPGIEGLDQPASEVIEQRTVGMFGAYSAGVDVPTREIFLPLMVKAADMLDWFAKRDVYNKITSPYADRTFRIWAHRPDGTTRWIDGYRTGQAPVWDSSTWVPHIMWQKFGQTYRCQDPWWRGSEQVLEWRTPAEAPTFFPILPVQLAPSQIFGTEHRVIVAGDVETSPVWEITGPATSVTVSHVDSGRSWTLNATLTAGQTAIVNTDPRAGMTAPRVQGPVGQSWWSNIEQPYDLWSIPIGEQYVTVEVDGAGTGTTVVMRIPSLWETV